MSLSTYLQVALAIMFSMTFVNGDAQVYLDPKTRSLRDKDGRHQILHGVNVVYKMHPYIPTMNGSFSSQDSLVEFDMKNLQTWGMNHVRLGVMWEAVETAPGIYNETYLDEIEQLINQMGEYGILTMIDAHQDVMARIACGEGIPDFYAREAIKGVKCHGDWSDKAFKNVKKIFGECRSIESYGYERDENDWPKISECNKVAFWKYYTTSEAMAIFDALYTNKNGLTDDFVAFWDRVAQKYAKNPYVIGFDPINEPFPADFESDTSILNPGVFDKKKLTPLYEKVFKKYKSANPNTIMYFETAQFPDSQPGVNPTGFESPPGGQNGSANHVLNDHSYCCQLGGDICKTGEPDVNKSKECAAWHGARIQTRADDAEKLGIPLVISEFGACYGSEVCAREISQVADECDRVMAVGWAYWQFKIYKDLTTTAETGAEGLYNLDGSLQDLKVKALARTYIQKAQGTIKSMNFSQNGDFKSTIVFDANIKEPTEVFMNQEYWYASGFKHSLVEQESRDKVNADFTFKNGVDGVLVIKIHESKELDGKTLEFEIQNSFSQKAKFMRSEIMKFVQ